MPIAVTCQCGAKFTAKDQLAGKKVKCPKCGNPLRVPEAAATAGGDKSNPAQSKPRKESAPPTPEAHVGSILDEFGIITSKTGVKCPECGVELPQEAALCVACGYHVKKGKQISVEGDTAARERREAEFRRQREAAARADRSRRASGGAASTQDTGEHFIWLSRGASIKNVFKGALQIILSPGAVFSELPTEGKTGAAIGFPVMATVALSLIYGGILIVLALVQGAMLAAQGGDAAANVPMVLAMSLLVVAANVGFSAVSALITVPILGLCISAIAHPIVRYAGLSPRTFSSTFRCAMYVLGTCLMIAGTLVGALIVPIYAFILLAYALIYHHRVSGPVGAMASIFGLIVGYVLAVVALSIVLLPLLAIVADALPQTAS